MPNRYLILIIAIVGLFAFGVFSAPLLYAQVRSTDIVLSISPQNPGPGASVTATLGSHVTDLDKAYISWSVGGGEASAGVGLETFAFTMEAVNTPVVLTTTINTIGGQSIQKKLTIASTDVDVLWEAQDSYTPPFYRGKALAGSQATFKVVAMPSLYNQSGKINMNNLSYTWSLDNNVQPASSGWGKNAYTFVNSYLDRGNSVEVEISDITGSINTSGDINLQTVTPSIVFYPTDSLLGTRWNRALTNGFVVSPEGETVVAEAYYFSPKNTATGDLTFAWSINDRQIQTPSPKNVLSIKPEPGESGSAIIKLMVENVKTLFQSTEKELQVQF